MMQRRFYYIEDMATILGKSIAGIYGHLARKQYDAVPPPMKLGRRLAWLVEGVEEWVNAKVATAKFEAEKYGEFMQAPPRRRGRPTKLEERQRRNEAERMEMLKTLAQSIENEDVKPE